MLGVFKNPTGTGEIIGLKQSIILEACEVYLRTKGQDLMPKFIQLSGNKKKNLTSQKVIWRNLIEVKYKLIIDFFLSLKIFVDKD